MTDQPVSLHRQGPPETVLAPEPAIATAALADAKQAADVQAAVGTVCEQWPTFLEAWVTLADGAVSNAVKYAAYRTAYHRGLDRLRASGWRGSGYVRWEHETNRAFLRALDGLGRVAGEIGETDEQQRCATFLRQLDPSWPPA